MEIKTKLSVNQNCWFIASQELGNAPITSIVIEVNKEETVITYRLTYNNTRYDIWERHAFATQQDLIQSLY